MSANPTVSPLLALKGASAVAILAATLAGCAEPPAQHARGREFFSVARYGPASERVVEDGEPVPHGGGQYLVGHPYTIAGRTYYPTENAHYSAVGLASWYGDAFHGRRTANGEVYDMRSLSAAHPTMPLPSYARVTNLGNGYSIIVRVNDRGPYSGGRIIDVSSRVADLLDIKSTGTAKVKVDYAGPAPLAGSDDSTLVASLRTDGRPASLEGAPSQTMVADAEPDSPRQPAAQPAPAPPRLLAADRPRDDDAPSPAPFVASANPKLLAAPLPPPRPFDLGEIENTLRTAAATPVARPPRRPVVQASAGERTLYFAAGETPALRRLRGDDPFAKVLGADPR
jgi:rare lipoprotein A